MVDRLIDVVGGEGEDHENVGDGATPDPQWAGRERRRPRSSCHAPRPSNAATASPAPIAVHGEVVTLVACRTVGAGAAAAGVKRTSGLDFSGSAVTSAISLPVTSGPVAVGAGL